MYGWEFSAMYTNVLGRIVYDQNSKQLENDGAINAFGVGYKRNYELYDILRLRINGFSNIINENNTVPDHHINTELRGIFTLFTNLNTQLIIGTDMVFGMSEVAYLNELDHFYHLDSKKHHFIQPYAKALFRIKDLDIAIEVRNPLKVNSYYFRGYNSFAYGTTFKLSWAFYD